MKFRAKVAVLATALVIGSAAPGLTHGSGIIQTWWPEWIDNDGIYVVARVKMDLGHPDGKMRIEAWMEYDFGSGWTKDLSSVNHRTILGPGNTGYSMTSDKSCRGGTPKYRGKAKVWIWNSSGALVHTGTSNKFFGKWDCPNG